MMDVYMIQLRKWHKQRVTKCPSCGDPFLFAEPWTSFSHAQIGRNIIELQHKECAIDIPKSLFICLKCGSRSAQSAQRLRWQCRCPRQRRRRQRRQHKQEQRQYCNFCCRVLITISIVAQILNCCHYSSGWSGGEVFQYTGSQKKEILTTPFVSLCQYTININRFIFIIVIK